MRRAVVILVAAAAAFAVGSIVFRPAPSDPVLRAVFEGGTVTVVRRVPGQPDEEFVTLDLTGENAWIEVETVMRAIAEREGPALHLHHVEVEADTGTPWPWIAMVLSPIARVESGFHTVRFRERDGRELVWRIPGRTRDELMEAAIDVARLWSTAHVHIGRRGRIDVSAWEIDADADDEVIRRAKPRMSVLPERPGDPESFSMLAEALAIERERAGGRLFLALSLDRPALGARPEPAFGFVLSVLRVCLDAEPDELEIDLNHVFLIRMGAEDGVTPAGR